MKIAQVVCVFPPYRGGVGNVAADYSAYLSRRHKVTVFTPNYGLGDFCVKDYKVTRLKPWLKYGNGVWLPQLLWMLKGYDIVHLHYPFFGAAEMVWLAKILFKKKFQLFIHYHMDVLGLPWWVKILSLPSRLIRNSLFRMADKISVASFDYIKHSQIKNYYNKHKDKFYELPFAVDTKRFFPLENKKQDENIELLFVGGLDKAHYFKGLDVLFKALNGLKWDKWRLSVVGSGDLKKYYENLAEKFKFNKKIKFKGDIDQDELIKEYQNADLLILPSINSNEAFGLVLLEAMACAVAIIATDLPGVRKVFSEKEGLLALAGDSNDLLRKIQSLIENKNRLKNMGKAGRELALNKYSEDKIKDKYENLFNK
ncbi:glycosyltransferase family 4 protein [Candidatus Parcubacteria bacterium]|nr:glycosyltransferase family 4 protein [Candidatus Parcubacteria bacterium]